MDEKQKEKAAARQADLETVVEGKAARKLRARRGKLRHVWFGFSVFGLIGWSVAVPCLLGAGLGLWLDENYPREHSWTLTLLLAGLTLGCYNAWRWLQKEGSDINRSEEEDHG